MKQTLVLGGPGTGKTTRLLGVMEEALERGVHPSQVAFVSFTNAAVDEARARAIERFGLKDDDLPLFRTTHSLAFRMAAISRNDVVSSAHLAEVAELTGELTDGEADSTVPASGATAHPLITVDGIARMRRVSLRQAWEGNRDVGGELDWFRLKRFCDAYRLFREDRGLVDYTAMLEAYAYGDFGPASARVAIVDEAQDLTELQWAVVEKAFSDADELWVGGDDDQSIHRWAGAAEDRLLSLPYAREVLPLSHRLPRAVFELSQEIVRRIERRYEKRTRSSGRDGLVDWVSSVEEVDLTQGSWLLLARTKHMLKPLEEEARRQGVLYSVKGISSAAPSHVTAIQAYETLRRGARVEGSDAAAALKALGLPTKDLQETRSYTAEELGLKSMPIWHDALIRIPLEDREYYLACMRRGGKLTSPPKVRVDTIHGAKGAEAEKVLLVTDMTYKVKRGYDEDPDGEHRVLYVGLTRASHELYLTMPRTVYAYPV